MQIRIVTVGDAKSYFTKYNINTSIIAAILTLIANYYRPGINKNIRIKIDVIKENYSAYYLNSNIDLARKSFRAKNHTARVHKVMEHIMHEFWHYIQCKIDKINIKHFDQSSTAGKAYMSNRTELQAYEFEDLSIISARLYILLERGVNTFRKLEYAKSNKTC